MDLMDLQPVNKRISFQQFRDYTIDAVIELYGECIFEHEQVVMAWKAVGLLDCDDIDYDGYMIDNGDGTSILGVNIANGSGCYGYEWLQNGMSISEDNLSQISVNTDDIPDISVVVTDNLLDCGKFEIDFFPNFTDNLINVTQLFLHPNPTSSNATISISTDNPIENTSIKLYDITGQFIQEIQFFKRITSQETRTFDVSNLSSGVYFIQMNSPNGVITKRLIKQ